MFNKHRDPDPHHDVSSNTVFGFWVYLMTDCIMFATFFATYAVVRTGTNGGPGPADIFHLPFVLKETIVLLVSSFTCGMAMTVIPHKRKMLGWFALTFILGALFLSFSFEEMARLTTAGNTWDKSAFLSAYFTLIGVHGLHILAGLVFLPVFTLQLIYLGTVEPVLRRLTCLRMYWHFLYIIWIFTFTIVYLIGVN